MVLLLAMRDPWFANARNAARVWLVAFAVLLAPHSLRSVSGAGPTEPDKAFITDHCAGCHNAKRGPLDLTGLPFDPSDSANSAVWIKVHDRVKAGEMPPRGRPRPDAARQKIFIDGLSQLIVAAEQAALAGEGRAIL